MDKKIKIKKESRDEKARRELREKSYGKRVALAQKKNEYIRNILGARYRNARCNMIVDQLNNNNILEKIDGCIKTKELLMADLAMEKLTGITHARNAHFASKDLMKEFGLSEEEIIGIEKDIYEGKIIRKDYDEDYRKGNKAEFVNSSKD